MDLLDWIGEACGCPGGGRRADRGDDSQY